MLVNKVSIWRYLRVQASKGNLILCATSDWITDRRMQRMAQTYAAKGYTIQAIGCKRDKSEVLSLSGIERVTLIETRAKRGIAFYAEFNALLLLLLLSTEADVIFSADADTLPACSLASWLKGSKLIYDAHEWFSQVPELRHKPWVGFLWDRIEKAFASNADQVFTVAPILSQKLSERLGGREVRCIPNYPNHWSGGVTEPDYTQHSVVYLGVLNEGRGLELALEAIKDLPIKLKIIGSGDIEAKLKAMAKELPEGQVIFTGRLQANEIQEACTGCLAGLMLLDDKHSLSYKYSLSNKFFDYVQMGLPVIANPLPEYVALSKQYPVLIETKDYSAQALRNCLISILTNPSIIDAARMQCKQAAQVWLWNDAAVPDLD